MQQTMGMVQPGFAFPVPVQMTGFGARPGYFAPGGIIMINSFPMVQRYRQSYS
ncbi:MAG: hypothetical protein P4M11_14980 [Candidatus Pacebacteria bacterium]|nr:hypothetical protein [Candidatus Paceibacterota bacterium]